MKSTPLWADVGQEEVKNLLEVSDRYDLTMFIRTLLLLKRRLSKSEPSSRLRDYPILKDSMIGTFFEGPETRVYKRAHLS